MQKAEQEILLNQNLQELEEAYEEKGGQDEAILIFPNGRIVNGNTRTSLMRRLGYEAIKCIVLEDEELKHKEIELEAEEDEVPSGKIDFDLLIATPGRLIDFVDRNVTRFQLRGLLSIEKEV